MLYMNNILIATKSMIEVDVLVSSLCQEFNMNDVGASKKILGMEIHRDKNISKL